MFFHDMFFMTYSITSDSAESEFECDTPPFSSSSFSSFPRFLSFSLPSSLSSLPLLLP